MMMVNVPMNNGLGNNGLNGVGNGLYGNNGPNGMNAGLDGLKNGANNMMMMPIMNGANNGLTNGPNNGLNIMMHGPDCNLGQGI